MRGAEHGESRQGVRMNEGRSGVDGLASFYRWTKTPRAGQRDVRP